jgi:hypothetical protein
LLAGHGIRRIEPELTGTRSGLRDEQDRGETRETRERDAGGCGGQLAARPGGRRGSREDYPVSFVPASQDVVEEVLRRARMSHLATRLTEAGQE